jgi:NAD-dependent deacetylase
MEKTMVAIVAALRRARRIVVFTGAGLSADSGIPTFRDGATGLWAGVDPEEVASLDGFDRNPSKVWAWHEAMRALFAQAEPNAGHHGIAELARRLPEALVTVITQNIDGLHQAVGSRRVLEIHGSVLRVRCHQDCGYRVTWHVDTVMARRCPSCGAPTRPDVVWFGEALDDDVFANAIDASLEADVFISVGTSSVVQPAASLPMAAKQNGALIVEVNPHATPFSPFADHTVRAGASAFFAALTAQLNAD